MLAWPGHSCTLGDVGLVVERVGGGRRAQRMGADLEAELRRISPHQPIDHVGIECLVDPAGAVVADRPEQSAVVVGAVAGCLEVITGKDQPRARDSVSQP
jgi:hypothetical protein